MAKTQKRYEKIESGALARFFSTSIIREFSQKRQPIFAQRLAQEAGIKLLADGNYTVRDFFEWAYKILGKMPNRHEYVYKNALADKVLLGTHSLNTSFMLTEFRSGSCKADVVILNGTSTVYEIKSERDGLERLSSQINSYRQIFDRINVIAGENHLTALESTLPNEIGILLLSKRFQIHEYRKAASNLTNVLPSQIFESLQRSEYLEILKQNGIETPNVPNTQIHGLAKQLFCTLSPAKAHQGMVNVLKLSRGSAPLKDFIRAVPKPLKAAAATISLSPAERTHFLETLDKSAETVLAIR